MHCDCSNCSLSLWTASKLEWRILPVPRPGEFQPQLKIEAWCSWRKGSDPSYCRGPGGVKCAKPSQPAVSLITSQSKVSRQSLVFVLFCFLKYDSFNVLDILNIHKIALFQKSFPLWYRFRVHDQRQFSETQPAERTQESNNSVWSSSNTSPILGTVHLRVSFYYELLFGHLASIVWAIAGVLFKRDWDWGRDPVMQGKGTQESGGTHGTGQGSGWWLQPHQGSTYGSLPLARGQCHSGKVGEIS